MFMCILHYPLCIFLIHCIFLMKVTKEIFLYSFLITGFLRSEMSESLKGFYLMCVSSDLITIIVIILAWRLLGLLVGFSNVELRAPPLSIELCFFASFEIHLLGFRCFDIFYAWMEWPVKNWRIYWLFVRLDWFYVSGVFSWSWWGHGRPWPGRAMAMTAVRSVLQQQTCCMTFHNPLLIVGH